ncbi:amino acid dehydrogenase [Alsobacter soli]|uniref:Amino acid dehydrogenase n=1 Tax=Alsobacter soli TaxID=2109933 RepID=A0A2T1HP39_9HYPH|nr:FAD-dependent oxidoreductase [Alsobacter soli]PSC03289.1 amino acid dehydrogenase [Alsobacter soli]
MSQNPEAHRRPVDVIVLGAGMVGVSTALAARRRGLEVVLLDRREPGRETSYGNAGIVSSGSVLPLNHPGLWKSLPGYLGNRHPALRYDPFHLIRTMPWSIAFLAHATPVGARRRSTALHGLLQASLALHRRWIREAGAERRLRETGWLKAWRSDSLEPAKREQAALAEFGIGSEILDRQAISGLEPDITPVYAVGLLHTQTASVDSPGEVVAAYAAMFAREGGRIEKTQIQSLSKQGDLWTVETEAGPLTSRHVVVALGPWSADLLRPLGYRVPLGFERGYHREFRAASDRSLRRPIHDVERAFVITPVENGVRVTSGVELAPRDAPSRLDQIEAATAAAQGVLPLGEALGEVWRGARPTLPDSLPAIGPAPRHPGLWLGFGHQHIGFTTGPGTGEALAAMMAGEQPPFDVASFRPARVL